MADHEEHHDDGHAKGKGGGHGGGGHGPHAAHEEGEAGAPEWLISFADNVTLMMAFFVILLAMNLKEPTTGGVGGKEENPSAGSAGAMDLSIAIRQAFNNPVSISSTNPYEQALVRRLRERAAGSTGSASQEGPQGEYDSVQALAPTDYYTPSGIVHFAMGSSELSAVGFDEIEQISGEIKDLTYVIEVRGHASPFEVFRNEREGMHLSYERALAVADALATRGIPWDHMRVVACSDGLPLADRARTRVEGEQSQVVEVITTGEPVQPRAGMPSPGSERTGGGGGGGH